MNERTNKRGGARPNSGPKPFVPTEQDRALVQALRGAGFTHEQIASQIGPRGISNDTLERRFKHELATGAAKINGICVTGLVKKMQAGDLGALCFWAKTRMGWREVQRTEIVGDKGGAIDLSVTNAKDALAARIAGIRERLAIAGDDLGT